MVSLTSLQVLAAHPAHQLFFKDSNQWIPLPRENQHVYRDIQTSFFFIFPKARGLLSLESQEWGQSRKAFYTSWNAEIRA